MEEVGAGVNGQNGTDIGGLERAGPSVPNMDPRLYDPKELEAEVFTIVDEEVERNELENVPEAVEPE